MKLYATIESERAKKAQGGNRIDVQLNGGEAWDSVPMLKVSAVFIGKDDHGKYCFDVLIQDQINGCVLCEKGIEIPVTSRICRHCGKKHNRALCD